MRKILLPLFAAIAMLFLPCPVPATAQTVPGGLSWTNVAVACPATNPTACAKSLTLSDVTSLTPVIITTAILPTQSSYVITPLPTAGVHNYLLVVNGFDAFGNAVTTAGATCGTANTPPPCAVTIPPPFVLAAPTGFKATAQ